MSYPQAEGLVYMTCAVGGDRGHQTKGPWFPFLVALHSPPVCHDQPMLTEGGRRMAGITRAWRDQGMTLECRFSGKGEGQGVACYSHGWGGVYHDLADERCPSYPIAAWLMRRHTRTGDA